MNKSIIIVVTMFLATFSMSMGALAQVTPQPIEERVKDLEKRVGWLDYKVRTFAGQGMMLFLFGAFCALWAQNTGRNPWLWFFLGLFLSVISVLILLDKNANDRKRFMAGS